ncbi:MAG: FHA domain-containing protein [Planctomycetes bacterium]|nr:FHA domain-containing protein [Planctomycetota bacterium]
MPKLVITQDGVARDVVLNSGDVLGRTAQNEIPLKVAEASRQHCKFTYEDSSWFVEDLGSSNGTQVNGRKVTKFELQDGDVIQVGKVELRFLDMEVEEAEPDAEWGDDEISLEDEHFLVVGGAGREGDVIKIPDGRLSVGRNAKHMLVLKHKSVSGDHAEIVRDGSSCTLRDLDSSNGTFVEGRKVMEAELQSGDAVRFGSVACTFGVGDPAAFAPPTEVHEVADQSSVAFTRVMGGDAVEDEDPGFALSGAAPKQREALWNIVALFMIVALGGGVWFFTNWSPDDAIGGATLTQSPSGNLVPALAWSFELPEGDVTEKEEAPFIWEAEPGDDCASSLVGDPVRDGSYACRVDRSTDDGPPVLATLQQALVVTPFTAYRLRAACIDASGAPVVGVVWLAEDTDEEGHKIFVPFARDVVVGRARASGDDWCEMGGYGLAPEGSVRARIGVGVAGSGGATFDGVSMVLRATPAGRSVVHGGVRSDLGAQGTVRVSRFGRRIIEGMGLEVESAGRVLYQDDLLVVNPLGPETAISGSLAGGLGDLSVAHEVVGSTLNVTLSGDALAKARFVRIPLVPRDEVPIQVTVLSGDLGHRHVQPFKDEVADALIMGGGSHRVRLRFAGPNGARPMKTSFERPRRALPVVRIGLDGSESLTLGFQVDFEKEKAKATSLVVEARNAEHRGEFGRAIQRCERVMAQYPFEEASEAAAAEIRKRLVQDGHKKTAALAQRLDDARFFRDLLHDTNLGIDVSAEAVRYKGTSLEPGLRKILGEYEKTLAAWHLPLREAEAERAFLRAKDYMDGEKRQLALLFFKTIVSEYPDTDEADQSAAYIQRLERGSGEGR